MGFNSGFKGLIVLVSFQDKSWELSWCAY